jgi:toxin ParE1/3/4
MLPVRWTPMAASSMAEIVEYIGQFDPEAARALRVRIDEAILPLSDHPYLFRRGRLPGTRELVAHQNYIVVYRVLDDFIEIADVIHARRQYP